MEGERSWCGSLVKMAKGVDVRAHGNGFSFVPCVEATPSLLPRGVVWKVSLAWMSGLFLCDGLLFFSHVSQPSADVKFGSVFPGETESNGHVSDCCELESVELGGFAHTHPETISVNSPHLFNGLFSYPLVTGANFLGLGLPCVFGPIGDWWMFVASVQQSRTRALLSSLLLMYVEEEGTQESSLMMAKDCVMSSRSRWGDLDLAAAVDGTLAPLIKSVLAETCAARWEVASIQGVLALTYARNVDLGKFFRRFGRMPVSTHLSTVSAKGSFLEKIKKSKSLFCKFFRRPFR